MRNSLLIGLVGLALISCEKEEIAIASHDSGDAIEAQIELGQYYKRQVFYRLSTNEVVSSNDKTAWDLGFESAAASWHIVLNSSRGMAVHRSDLAFGDLTSENGLAWTWDVQSGNLDSTAFGDWNAGNSLYVLDMGYDHLGNHQGHKKLVLTDVNATEYTLEYGDLTDLTPQITTVQKNTDNLFTFFKFGIGEVTIAPPNEAWDLEFTQYTHLFYDPMEAYVVTGVLLNRHNTSAAHIANKPFSEINYEDALSLTYSKDLDYIGYDWKWYDYETMLYTVDPTITYIVKTNQGFYYKLHFIDFYNNLGQKGYPKMELQLL